MARSEWKPQDLFTVPIHWEEYQKAKSQIDVIGPWLILSRRLENGEQRYLTYRLNKTLESKIYKISVEDTVN